MKSETNITDAVRQSHSTRPATAYRIRIRAGTSFGQPVPVGFYLHPVLDENSGVNRKKNSRTLRIVWLISAPKSSSIRTGLFRKRRWKH
jgi:hypothetical protein